MSNIPTFTQDPQDREPVLMKYAGWLGSDDSLVDSAWTLPDGITADGEDRDATSAIIFITGGTIGQRYKFTNHVTAVSGREKDRSFYISVKEN